MTRRALLRQYVRSRLALVHLRLLLLGRRPAEFIVRRGLTDVCIEGFPRSANSFFTRMFRTANPGAVIAHHTHSVANVARAVRYGVPVLVLIRKPLDAIPSAVVANRRGDVADEIQRYLFFYRRILRIIQRVTVSTFEEATTDVNGCIERLNAASGSKFRLLSDSAASERKVRGDIAARFAERSADSRSTLTPLPDGDRAASKARWAERVARHPSFDQVSLLYDSVLQRRG